MMYVSSEGSYNSLKFTIKKEDGEDQDKLD